MKKQFVTALIVAASFALTPIISFAQTVTVGGELMYPAKDIVDNAVNSKDHTTLVAAVKAGGLVETLKSKGPFTVFAPVNDAFENLPNGTVESLLLPSSKATLTKVLTYHVVAGKYDFTAIQADLFCTGRWLVYAFGKPCALVWAGIVVLC